MQIVHSKGIFHGLPSFPDVKGGLTATVAGANDISGQYIVRALAEAPERWSRIVAISRRPPTYTIAGLKIEHLALDLIAMSALEISNVLSTQKIKPDYAVFCSYVQPPAEQGRTIWEDAERLTAINLQLLSHFLERLAMAQALPKRILVQFGMKYYGVHLGPVVWP